MDSSWRYVTPSNKKRLQDLKNVGKAMLADLRALSIESVEQLAAQDPDELYARLQEITGQKHDPCVWDVFAAIIHQAKTGEATPWWEWTPKRKARSSC
ncbi:MAG: TfoX/Sxy family DNA transformation protein [Chlamydiales bacterium]|nr:TfoX/Sxy family DNA transformation protein [Chlamydiales bacterium]